LKSESFLNLGAGKDILKPVGYPMEHPDKRIFKVNVDSGYHPGEVLHYTDIEKGYDAFIEKGTRATNQTHYSNINAFDFLDKCKIQFDGIIMYRFMEHIGRSSLLYFIYLLSTSIKQGGLLDIIVPDYSLLARRLLKESVGSPGWENEDIILTTEFCNEPGMPHASVWTTDRAKYYLQLEKRFFVKNIETPFIFDGRDIYMRIVAERL